VSTGSLSVASRIVVRPPNWLGDAVLALPALAAIRAAYPAAHLTVAAPASVAALFREQTPLRPDQVVELPDATGPAVAALRGGRFDLGILFPNSFRSAWQFWRAGLPARWGFATAGRGPLLTRRSPRGRSASRHQSDYYRALVTGLGIACEPDVPPALAPSPPSEHRATALLAERQVPASARLVVLAPGAAYGQAKQWPPDRMAALAARLVSELDAICLVVGATHDRNAARAVESWLREHAPAAAPRVVDLVGRTSLGALIGVTAKAAVFVSNDSGGMHLAAALGRPVVAVFGPTDERATRPIGDHDVLTAEVFCRPCMLRDCPIDHRCMKRITVETVFDAVARRIRAGAGR
jgi:lipopolysaccharide heptosyltransferase II